MGKLLEKGYLVSFKNNECVIYDKENYNQIISKINMLKNRIFTFNLSCETRKELNIHYCNSSWLWNVIHGHPNITILQLSHNNKIVKGFPLINLVYQLHEGCILGKKHRDSFIVGNLGEKKNHYS